MKKLILFYSIFLFLFSCKHKNSENAQGDNAQKDSLNTSYNLKDTTIQVIWREKYDLGTLVINDNYFKTISDPERAAIGYVATFVGSECDWDGKAKDDRSNLNCKVIKALNLGYQCSDTHLNFLRHWFKNDTTILAELKHCPITPFTAINQNTFTSLTIKTKADRIDIFYEASWAEGMGEGNNGDWTDTLRFKIDKDQLIILEKRKEDN